MRKAFTLIELLVVIAIIAILAAILFPVFAQAKLAAKKTVVLSNAKEIGTGQLLYVNDYDDYSPSLGTGDYTDHLYPYIKNEDVFLNPIRNDVDGGCQSAVAGGATPPGAGSDEPGCKYGGFGYNWGPIKRRGGGMIGRQQPDSGGSGADFIPGISETSITNPADMFNFTTSYDTPRITMGIFFFMCTFKGSHTSDMFFAGNLPVVFADGHAKALQWRGGFGVAHAENNEFAMPSNLSLVQDYCSDPNVLVDTSGDVDSSGANVADGFEGIFPTGTKCSDIQNIVSQWPSGGYSSSSGTPTFFSN